MVAVTVIYHSFVAAFPKAIYPDPIGFSNGIVLATNRPKEGITSIDETLQVLGGRLSASTRLRIFFD
jgi:hypothetical protein